MTLQHIMRHQQYAFSTARNKGFWEQGEHRNKGEMVMLIITELSEMVEAHRADRICVDTDIKNLLKTATDNVDLSSLNTGKSWFVGRFESHVKDTVQDEMADAVIRILDYTAGWNIKVYEREFRKHFTGNFAEDTLTLTDLCIKAFQNVSAFDWGYVLAAIFRFCSRYKIELDDHIVLKMMYNKERLAKHGKLY